MYFESPQQQAVVNHLISKHLNGGVNPQVMERRVNAGGLSPEELRAATYEQQLGRQMVQEVDAGAELMSLTRQLQDQALETRQVNAVINRHLGLA